MTISTKLQKVLFRLSNLYFPFNNLSPERLQEIVNHIRIIELQQDEILQIRGSASQDYLYLMEGEIDIICEGNIRTINHPDETQRKPVQLPSNQSSCSIMARTDCIISHANRDTLDSIIAWDHIGRESRDSVKHIDLIRNALLFERLPFDYIESAFSRMKPCYLKKGDSIQSEQCDAYYLILNGRVEVQKYNHISLTYKRAIELSTGDIFGQATEVAGKQADENFYMLEDSEVLILGREDYQELISRPVIRNVQAEVARTMLDNGYQLLDVRFPEEHSENRIPGAKLIPLSDISKRIEELDPSIPYIVYCHSGPRSTVAALILNQKNIEALSLEGGIRDWPYDIEQLASHTNLVSSAKKFH